MSNMNYSKKGHNIVSIVNNKMLIDMKKTEITITKLEEVRGAQTTIKTMDSEYRLDDPWT